MFTDLSSHITGAGALESIPYAVSQFLKYWCQWCLLRGLCGQIYTARKKNKVLVFTATHVSKNLDKTSY